MLKEKARQDLWDPINDFKNDECISKTMLGEDMFSSTLIYLRGGNNSKISKISF